MSAAAAGGLEARPSREHRPSRGAAASVPPACHPQDGPTRRRAAQREAGSPGVWVPSGCRLRCPARLGPVSVRPPARRSGRSEGPAHSSTRLWAARTRLRRTPFRQGPRGAGGTRSPTPTGGCFPLQLSEPRGSAPTEESRTPYAHPAPPRRPPDPPRGPRPRARQRSSTLPYLTHTAASRLGGHRCAPASPAPRHLRAQDVAVRASGPGSPRPGRGG